MLQRWIITLIVSFSLTGAGAHIAFGQNYPGQSIRMVTAAAGGGSDFVARLIARGLSATLGQQVIVDNRGGIVSIPVMLVAKAAPDGYTLLFFGSSMWVLPFLQKTPYDPV